MCGHGVKLIKPFKIKNKFTFLNLINLKLQL